MDVEAPEDEDEDEDEEEEDISRALSVSTSPLNVYISIEPAPIATVSMNARLDRKAKSYAPVGRSKPIQCCRKV